MSVLWPYAIFATADQLGAAALQGSIRTIAAAFDADDASEAFRLLHESDLRDLTAPSRRVLLGLWRRAYAAPTKANGLDPLAARRLVPFFIRLEAALRHQDVWPLMQEVTHADALIGAKALARIMATVLWDTAPKAPYGFQYEILNRTFLGGDTRLFQDLFAQVMSQDHDFVPDYWQVQSLIRTWAEVGDTATEASIAALIRRTGRADLLPLLDVFALFAAQTDAKRAFDQAGALNDPRHREKVATYLLGASQPVSLIARARDLHADLTDETALDERAFMDARVALVDGRWADVLALTDGLVHHQSLRNEAICLRGLAHAHLGDHPRARQAIAHVRHNTGGKWFLKARADLINVTNRLLTDQVPLPNTVEAPALRRRAGRPLAQSLWIGPRLRWIEEMSIQSYLVNGWRFQLYVYDIPENVPDGVEIMDAAPILPRSEFFVEGEKSGIHKGSVGAFSDLFRYALLAQRGGMWTDTDVINLRRFDPDGARFISTEYSDAGLIGLNGAMMAAPAGDRLQRDALTRSRAIIERGGLHFARIGPELLAESIGEMGLQGYTLLPTHFLNPIGWMETGRLLRPFDEVQRDPILTKAANIHVYTETWRLIGLSLKTPPKGAGFLAVLHDRLMNTAPGQADGMNALLDLAA